jgi:hypothetical protein
MWNLTRFRSFILRIPIFIGLATVLLTPIVGNAQYFTSEQSQRIVLRSSGRDSVILLSSTPFEVPAVNDTLGLIYHEPMPDSIMPRSAIVIGTVTIQSEEAADVMKLLEKYARKLGADWIVSFQEPRASLDGDHWKVYRSTALLLHVLDEGFVNQNNIEYSYYGPNHLQNYASVSHWYDQFGKHFGSKFDEPEPVK